MQGVYPSLLCFLELLTKCSRSLDNEITYPIIILLAQEEGPDVAHDPSQEET